MYLTCDIVDMRERITAHPFRFVVSHGEWRFSCLARKMQIFSFLVETLVTTYGASYI